MESHYIYHLTYFVSICIKRSQKSALIGEEVRGWLQLQVKRLVERNYRHCEGDDRPEEGRKEGEGGNMVGVGA